MSRIPVTVLTGFLGSGKTTLLNRILAENHGQRIAVIENEFGEIGVDQELVINADEEVLEMNNGCICCTVRGDLIRILGTLSKRRHRFDRVVVETTGVANPGPVAQTFFVDENVRRDYVLDGIVTLVDARHISSQLQSTQEAHEQIAFADVIVLNKTDLAVPTELEKLEQGLRSMNAMARIERARMASVPMDTVLGVGGFDLTRALERRPKFLEPEYPFEWGGMFELDAGGHALLMGPGPDPNMSVVLVPMANAASPDWRVLAESVFPLFSQPPLCIESGEHLQPMHRRQQLQLTGAGYKQFTLDIAAAGRYLLFTQHRPEEFDLHIDGVVALAQHEFAPAHEHDSEIGSVCVAIDEPLDQVRFNAWLNELLRARGADLYRLKGFLNLAGVDARVVIQGVHMLIDCAPLDDWGTRARRSELVLIGRNLDAAQLRQGLLDCVADGCVA
jgi:G3E family GTPase